MTCELINYYAKNAATFLADERVKAAGPLTAQKKLVKSFHPYPVVGIITPWNFPFAMPGMDAIPALAAGAAVIASDLPVFRELADSVALPAPAGDALLGPSPGQR